MRTGIVENLLGKTVLTCSTIYSLGKHNEENNIQLKDFNSTAVVLLHGHFCEHCRLRKSSYLGKDWAVLTKTH